MTKQTVIALLLFVVLALNACQSNPTPAPTTPAPGPVTSSPGSTVPSAEVVVVASARQRLTSPSASQAEVSELVEGNNAFALKLYQAWSALHGNLIFSPYSILQALAMTYAGARGNTEQQVASVLHFTLPQARLHSAFNALDLALQRAPDMQDEAGTAFQLNIANSIWGQKGYAFLPDFLDVLAENYGAGLRITDFVAAPESARVAINRWVEEQTQDKIKDLIPLGAISSDTRLVLANAIYFKAGWQYPFEPSLTKDAGFKLLTGDQVTAPLMVVVDPKPMLYARGANYQAVALPYLGNKTSMLIVLPDEGQFVKVQAGFTSDTLTKIVAGLESKMVKLALPKFKFESETGLKETLAGMGMPDAFKAGVADFSGMDGKRDLSISAVLHKAFVGVDEEGTEAAAATAVVVGVTSLPQADVELTIDRPFIFLIRDDETGSILFVGQMLDPRS